MVYGLKKGVPILFAAVVLFNTLGYLYLFNWNRSIIRKEIKSIIKNSLPTEDLVIITDIVSKPSGQMRWENKKEFWKDHMLFDVVSKEILGDTIIYKCIRDTQEEKLFAKLHEYVSDTINGKGTFQTKHKIVIKQTIVHLYYNITPKWLFGLNSIRLNFGAIDCYLVTCHDTPTPPPKEISLTDYFL